MVIILCISYVLLLVKFRRLDTSEVLLQWSSRIHASVLCAQFLIVILQFLIFIIYGPRACILRLVDWFGFFPYFVPYQYFRFNFQRRHNYVFLIFLYLFLRFLLKLCLPFHSIVYYRVRGSIKVFGLSIRLQTCRLSNPRLTELSG